MILNHLWGLYAHPLEEWQTIDNRHESLTYSLSHIVLIALFPSVMGYYSSVYLGWSIGTGNPVFLTHDSALLIAIAMYVALIAGIFALAYLAHWMGVTFGAQPTCTQALELAAYTATPVYVGTSCFFTTFMVCGVRRHGCFGLLGVLTLYRCANINAYTRRTRLYLRKLCSNLWLNFTGYYFSGYRYAMD